MRRSNIFLVICLFFLLFLFKTQQTIPVFLIDSEPSVLTKGQSNNAYMLVVSFEQDGLLDFMTQNKQLPITYLVTADLLKRSPLLSKTLQVENYSVGLLGANGEAYEQQPNLLLDELTLFQKTFQQTPMYFMTQDQQYNQSLLKELYKQQINAVAPTKLTSYQQKPQKGLLLYEEINETQRIDFSKLLQYIRAHNFTSIEETIFGGSLSSNATP